MHPIHINRGDTSTFSSYRRVHNAFHHGKEEKVHTFEQLRVRMHGYSEDIRKLLIEHELVRRIAIMLRLQTQLLKSSSQTGVMEERTGGKRKRSYDIPNELRRRVIERYDMAYSL
jgi:hemerythrin-like domain-containing protein